MNTWSIIQLALDIAFGALICGVVVGFLYRRERRMEARFAEALTGMALQHPRVDTVSPKPIRQMREESKLSRAEKYLEAVRLYRGGADKKEIERSLGISLLELELLGQMR